MINLVLCDDNISFLNGLEKTLNNLIIKHDFNAKVGFKSTNIDEILNYINNNVVNVLFLDISLNSNKSGIDIAEKIRNTNKNIYFIFITGHLEYTFQAFQVKSFDYLPKPITSERLEQTLLRLFDDIEFSKNNFISINNKTFISEKNIYYIRKDGMKLLFKTDTDTIETYSSFSKISKVLPYNFIRCHKSYIVNVNNIKYIESTNNTMSFQDNSICYIGPKYKRHFMEVINDKIPTDYLYKSNIPIT